MEAGLVAWRARGISAQMMAGQKEGSQWNSHPKKKSLEEVGVFEMISDNFAQIVDFQRKGREGG